MTPQTRLCRAPHPPHAAAFPLPPPQTHADQSRRLHPVLSRWLLALPFPRRPHIPPRKRMNECTEDGGLESPLAFSITHRASPGTLYSGHSRRGHWKARMRPLQDARPPSQCGVLPAWLGGPCPPAPPALPTRASALAPAWTEVTFGGHPPSVRPKAPLRGKGEGWPSPPNSTLT